VTAFPDGVNENAVAKQVLSKSLDAVVAICSQPKVTTSYWRPNRQEAFLTTEFEPCIRSLSTLANLLHQTTALRDTVARIALEESWPDQMFSSIGTRIFEDPANANETQIKV
jgi:hypothetical protein